MTGEDNPQGMPGGGFQHGGFNGGMGINIEDLMRGFGGFGMGGGFGEPQGFGEQGRFGGQQRQGQQRQQGGRKTTYSFSFGGGMPGGGMPGGMRFEF